MTMTSADHDAQEISRTGIPILHDAAHSFGSTRSIGNQHQYTMFSFDPVALPALMDCRKGEMRS